MQLEAFTWTETRQALYAAAIFIYLSTLDHGRMENSEDLVDSV